MPYGNNFAFGKHLVTHFGTRYNSIISYQRATATFIAQANTTRNAYSYNFTSFQLTVIIGLNNVKILPGVCIFCLFYF